MKRRRYSLLFIAAVAVATAVIAAENKHKAATSTAEHKVFEAANLEWGDPPPGLPAGAKAALLSGDPSAKGLFTVRLRAPAGYKVLPHTHPTAEEITVISGSFHIGAGDKFDESAAQSISAGGFTSMPPGMKHYAWFTEDSVIQINSEGPFQITYVNSADDPRNTKK